MMSNFQLLFQVGRKLSELIRDSGNQAPGSEQSRWQVELSQVAIELIGVSIKRLSMRKQYQMPLLVAPLPKKKKKKGKKELK